MANTYVDDTATASQQYFAFNFPYLEDEHVIVEIEGVDQTITTNYTIETSPTQRINLSNPTTALAGGELVRIKRRSAPNTNLVDFQNGSVLTEAELDRAYLHNRYLAEEATEGADSGLKELEGSTNYNAGNKQIKNLADGTLATDAVNKQYVDTQIALSDTNLAGFYKSTHTGNGTDNVFTLSFTPQTTDAKAYIVSIDGLVQVPDTDYTIGATAITFNTIPSNSAEICVVATAAASVTTVNEARVTALGTSDTRSLATWTRDLGTPIATGSTTARSLEDRFGDVVNVLDYGADNTGATDAYSSFQSAITAIEDTGKAGVLYVPPGTYKMDSGITIDASVCAIKGQSATLDFSSLTASDVAITVDGADINLTGAPYYNAVNFIQGLRIDGPAKGTATGIKFTNTSTFLGSNDYAVRDCVISKFQVGMLLGNVCYHMSFHHLNIFQTSVCVKLEEHANAGARNVFNRCTFYNSDYGFQLFNRSSGNTDITDCVLAGLSTVAIYIEGGHLCVSNSDIEPGGSHGANYRPLWVHAPAGSNSYSYITLTGNKIDVKNATSVPVFGIDGACILNIFGGYLYCNPSSTGGIFGSNPSAPIGQTYGGNIAAFGWAFDKGSNPLTAWLGSYAGGGNGIQTYIHQSFTNRISASSTEASFESVESANEVIAGNGIYGNDNNSISITTLNTYFSLGVGTASGLVMFRDSSLGGIAAFALDTSGQSALYNNITGLNISYQAGQLSARLTSGSVPRTLRFTMVKTANA